ncbi:MAG: DUF2799 domain-containing protein [Magnetococcales bacterium]|nr:DUF2799 domain-containing protein [Magnetococcales bacterium]
MRMQSRVVALASLLLAWQLSGCASLSKEECLAADWRTIGFGDGAAGKRASRLDDHREACADYSVKPNLTAYLAGRDAGLLTYCRPGKGYSEGSNGRSYEGVCPAELEGPFLSAYRSGKIVHDAESAVSAIEKRIRESRNDLENLKTRLMQAESKAVASGLSDTDRKTAVNEVVHLSEEKGRLEETILESTSDLALSRNRLEQLRREFRHWDLP